MQERILPESLYLPETLSVISCDIKKPCTIKIQGFSCGRWDLNPHERNAHKILSLARLPVPTLPHIAFLFKF